MKNIVTDEKLSKTKVVIFRAFDVTGHIIVREKDEIYKHAKRG